MTFHEDRLIAAFNKYWRPLTEDEYLDTMDLVDTNNAIAVANFPKNVDEWIWKKKRNLGEIF